jgi:glucan biosynthesis protein C
VFSLLALPVFLYLRGEAGKALLARVSTVFETPWGIFAPALPLVLVQAFLRARWPGFPPNLYDDWANFSFYLILFVYGYALFLAPGFDRAIRRRWKASLLLGVGTISVIFLVLGTGDAPEIGYTPAFMAFAALHGLNTWFWLVAVAGAARTYLGFENRALRYLRDAVYPMYILHQTVVVGVGFLVVPWEVGVAGKFALIVLASLAVTLALYEFVRRVAVLRPLLGLKPKRRGLRSPPAASTTDRRR